MSKKRIRPISRKVMNTYKEQRERFFKTHFNYPVLLETAIQQSMPIYVSTRNIYDTDIYAVKDISGIGQLKRILDNNGYGILYYWTYNYMDVKQFDNWARLEWNTTEGLGLNFDCNGHSCMDENEWNFIYSKRRIIFTHFYPGSLLKTNGDIHIRLTDCELTRLVHW